MEIPLHLQDLSGRGPPYQRPKRRINLVPNFTPLPGDIIIREIRYVSPSPPNVDGKLEVYTGETRNNDQTFFSSGDLVLRHGTFSANFSWEFGSKATLFYFFKEPYERIGKWYQVAERIDPISRFKTDYPQWAHLLEKASKSSSLSFVDPTNTSSVAINTFGFFLYPGDFIITRKPADDVPWKKDFFLAIMPARVDARQSGKDFGSGDVLVRVKVTPEPGNVTTMEAHGIFCMEGFLDWRYMGRRDAVFQK